MMTHLPARHPVHTVVALSVALLLALAMIAPAVVLGHAELETSDPADGASVEGPFAGPIVITFSEDLEAESSAELRDGAGRVASTAAIDGATISLTPDAALADGEYEVRWTAAADDGHIERGSFRFTVLPAATPEPTASPTPTPEETASPTTEATATATATPEGSPSAIPATSDGPVPTTAPDGSATSSGSDVLLPIVAAVVIVGALAVFLLRRRDSTSTPS
jgi:methionine-rich copper-binding protein CopC